jgi:tetratricopeptide (TPR) repeat protein
MMRVQNKETFKRALLRSGTLVCLFLAGCGDRSYDLGHAHMKKGLYDRAISDFNKALEINPRYAAAYNNRGYAYYNKRKYDKAWEDVHKTQGLGYQVHPESLKSLREASGREK